MSVLNYAMFAALMAAFPSSDKCTVEGEVFYLQRIALPQNAMVSVRLEEQGIADKAADIFAESEFSSEGKQVPLPFKLEADCADLENAVTPGFTVRIMIDGKLRFINTVSNPYDENQDLQRVQVDPVG
ncbi:YbaY family lipoprotein [Maritalea sp. S77]|uniref:YbaY family lipoprotein n=1 Tax=Maritalea sp. S77 TaxID=3415125 RepID=UPI003C7E2316